jgi:hypothetical protein
MGRPLEKWPLRAWPRGTSSAVKKLPVNSPCISGL